MVLCWSWKHRLIKIRNNVLSEIVSSHCATHFPCLEFNNLLFWPCFCRHTFENNFSNQNSINIKKTQFLWLLIFFTVFVVVSGITYTRLQYIYSLNQIISNILRVIFYEREYHISLFHGPQKSSILLSIDISMTHIYLGTEIQV